MALDLEKDIDHLYQKIVEKTVEMTEEEVDEFDAATSERWAAIHLRSIRCRDALAKSKAKTEAAVNARAVAAAKQQAADAAKMKRDSLLAAYEILKADSKASEEEAEGGARAKFYLTQPQVLLKKLYEVLNGKADGGLTWISEERFQLKRTIGISEFCGGGFQGMQFLDLKKHLRALGFEKEGSVYWHKDRLFRQGNPELLAEIQLDPIRAVEGVQEDISQLEHKIDELGNRLEGQSGKLDQLIDLFQDEFRLGKKPRHEI